MLPEQSRQLPLSFTWGLDKMVIIFTAITGFCCGAGAYVAGHKHGEAYGKEVTLNELHTISRESSARHWAGFWVPHKGGEPEEIAHFYYSLGISDAMESLAEYCAKKSGRDYKSVVAREMLDESVKNGAHETLAESLTAEELALIKSGGA